MLSFKPNFSLSYFTFIKRLFNSSSPSAIRVVSSVYLRLLITSTILQLKKWKRWQNTKFKFWGKWFLTWKFIPGWLMVKLEDRVQAFLNQKACAYLLSHVRLFAAPWTVAHQAPPSMDFSRQEYWSELPFPSPGDLPYPGIEPWVSRFVGRCFTVCLATKVAMNTSCSDLLLWEA